MAKKILFACNMNSVRSPMAAALLRQNGRGDFIVDSAGVYQGGLDPFAEIVMREADIHLASHEPKTLNDLDLLDFDTVIALTAEAAVAARRILPHQCIEFWDVENPSKERGGKDEILAAYRQVRDSLKERLRTRFPELYEKS